MPSILRHVLEQIDAILGMFLVLREDFALTARGRILLQQVGLHLLSFECRRKNFTASVTAASHSERCLKTDRPHTPSGASFAHPATLRAVPEKSRSESSSQARCN